MKKYTIIILLIMLNTFAAFSQFSGGNADGYYSLKQNAPYYPEILTGAVSGNTYCLGSAVSVPYTAIGTYNQGNIFSVQLSDPAGSFASPTIIGSYTSTSASGTISAALPLTVATGSGYRVRVVSSSPNVTGNNNGSDLTVQALSAPTLVSPANGSISNPLTPVLNWLGDNCATSYWLLLSKSPNFEEQFIMINLWGHQSNAYTIPNDVLQENTQYYWTVKSVIEANGVETNESPWANAFTFTTAVNPIKNIALSLIMQGMYNFNTSVHQPAYITVELRIGTTLMSSTLFSRKPAFVQSTANLSVDFGDVPDGSYWLVVRSAGYLPLAIPEQVNLTTSGVNWNFTTESTQSAGGVNAMLQDASSGKWMMRAGDFNNSRSVTATDANIFLQSNGRNVTSMIPAP